MKTENIISEVVNSVQKELGEKFLVQHKEIIKTNNTMVDAICICEKTDEEARMGLAFYINSYINSEMSAEEIASELLESYKNMRDEDVSPSKEEILEYDRAKNRLTLTLINREANKSFLKEIPFKEFLDLAIIVEVNGDNYYTKVSEQLIKHWGKDFEEVYRVAYENLFANDTTIISDPSQILGNVLGIKSIDGLELYALSNADLLKGAIRILDDRAIKAFALSHGYKSLILIPSSIHEFLLMPYSDDIKISDIDRVIQEVNRESVPEEWILSDHCYIWNNGKIGF